MNARKILARAFEVALILIWLFPLAWMVITSLKYESV